MLPTINDVAPRTTTLRLRLCGIALLVASVAGLAILVPGGTAAPPTGPSGQEPTVDGQPLFASWPGRGQQKPDAAIILTGQTYGLLQPCGCSRPQKGGLERRMQFISTLKAKGWPVAGVDLGDIVPDKPLHPEHALLRYKTTMNAIRAMGYVAVGVGKTEFAIEIDKVLGEYAAQKDQPPYVLAGNLKGDKLTREQRFPSPPGAKRPLIDVVEAAPVGQVMLGVVGVVGKSIQEEVKQANLDPSVAFDDNAAVLKSAVKTLAGKKTQLNVLLYHGTFAEAQAVAMAHPEFHVILCRSEESELPATATPANNGKTLIVKVGDKGRYVGVMGAFKKNGGGFDLHYQLVPLDEFYITPGTDEEAHKKNVVLPLLEEYSRTVRDAKTIRGGTFLEDMPRKPHPAQIAVPQANLSYVGSDTCKACHVAEHAAWAKTPHSKALVTLETVAKRPSLRNFDPECVRCHTVGFEHDTGYINEEKTPELKHVGCENCHGPGSGHAANPKAQNLHQFLSPWKRGKPGNLPAAVIKKMAETKLEDRGKIQIQPADQLMINLVSGMCAKCHDPDNDPHFDLYTYWPKVNHSGLAPPGGWPAVPPK
jgi:cytochrome c554/c'-like protein